MADELDIPDFLRREYEPPKTKTRHRHREKKIPYPPDGYACKGMKQKTRERMREARRRYAKRCRER